MLAFLVQNFHLDKQEFLSGSQGISVVLQGFFSSFVRHFRGFVKIVCFTQQERHVTTVHLNFHYHCTGQLFIKLAKKVSKKKIFVKFL